MALHQEVKDEALRQLDDGHWHTTEEVWKRTFSKLFYTPAYGHIAVQDFLEKIYATVQQI